MLNAAGKFVQTVVPGILKPLRVLWNEMIGFVFLVFAVFAAAAAWRAWETAGGTGEGQGRLVLAAFFALVMAWCGVASFRRARKINRS
jgi:hypothetical protein